MFSVENSGLRYRLSEDHLVKEIPFSQITQVKIKTNYPPYAILLSNILFYFSWNNF
jgi:hypothetical protein